MSGGGRTVVLEEWYDDEDPDEIAPEDISPVPTELVEERKTADNPVMGGGRGVARPPRDHARASWRGSQNPAAWVPSPNAPGFVTMSTRKSRRFARGLLRRVDVSRHSGSRDGPLAEYDEVLPWLRDGWGEGGCAAAEDTRATFNGLPAAAGGDEGGVGGGRPPRAGPGSRAPKQTRGNRSAFDFRVFARRPRKAD